MTTRTSGPADVTPAVLAWGGPRLRDLPWRRTRDPWAILVAEVMLQQTQADRVIPKWESFLESFPTPAACADEELGAVLRLWQGLGYPRRARNLHAAARMVTVASAFPDTLDGLLALPGIGPYTARAVLVFAYEADEAVVDTNIARVLARVGGLRLTARQAQSAADALVPRGQGWLWNQVFMDLGAMVCRPAPHCDACPVAPACSWRRAGLPEPDPAVGSAGVSTPQAPFAGSDRQARGRLLAALGPSAVDRSGVPVVMGRDDTTAYRLLEALVADGLVVIDDGTVRLP